jgi:hypothetical protein
MMKKLCVDAIVIVDYLFVQTLFLDPNMDSASRHGEKSQPPHAANLNTGVSAPPAYLSTQPEASGMQFQQPATVVYLANSQPAPAALPQKSYLIHMVVAIMVLFCCNLPLGAVALYIACK